VNPQQLWEASAPAWIALMESGDANRTVLLDPVMLRLAGYFRGLQVCEVGCGEGRFCRMLAERGADVIGVDPTRALISEAGRKDPAGRYLVGGAESIPVLDGSFDLVISYLVLIDVADYHAAIREMARIAKSGGRVLVANINSFCTTSGQAWVKNDEGCYLHVAVDGYFEEKAEVVSWAGIRIVNYHRPFGAYVRAFLDSGLRLTYFEEPAPSADDLATAPQMAEAVRVPFFHCMQWRKES